MNFVVALLDGAMPILKFPSSLSAQFTHLVGTKPVNIINDTQKVGVPT